MLWHRDRLEPLLQVFHQRVVGQVECSLGMVTLSVQQLHNVPVASVCERT